MISVESATENIRKNLDDLEERREDDAALKSRILVVRSFNLRVPLLIYALEDSLMISPISLYLFDSYCYFFLMHMLNA